MGATHFRVWGRVMVQGWMGGLAGGRGEVAGVMEWGQVWCLVGADAVSGQVRGVLDVGRVGGHGLGRWWAYRVRRKFAGTFQDSAKPRQGIRMRCSIFSHKKSPFRNT